MNDGKRRDVPTGRPVLTVALDEDTHGRFLHFCETEGVTGSALIEAFARKIVQADQPGWAATLIVDARAIFGERRRRRPG